MNISSGSGSELIQIADAVAKEKLIDPKSVSYTHLTLPTSDLV